MKKATNGAASLIMSVIEVIIGILLLINPVGFTSGILVVFGIVMMVIGIVEIFRYFTSSAEEAAQNGLLGSGLLFIGLGAFCSFRSDWLIAAFPVITVLYGILILVSGVAKLQVSVDLLRLKQKYWYVALIGAVVTLLFAILIICNPFTSTVVLWTFIGVALIVEAVLDILTCFFSRKGK
ncbi:MAG: DUF308 domain-containing protein [Firmicutes bacterium]|nr:DUF308 domain-containing protein [Bacillota bacterium]